MSELTEKLTEAAKQHAGTDFGALLQWAVSHIESQDEALAEVRTELEEEQNERIRMEQAIHDSRAKMAEISAELAYSRPVNIKLARDHAPHINRMAAAGVAPYAAKPSRPRSAT